MTPCDNCPYPVKCLNQDRCIVYKIGAVAPELPQPKPVPVKTTYGIGTTGQTGIAKKRKASKK